MLRSDKAASVLGFSELHAEFLDKDIEDMQEKIAARHGYELVDHSLTLYVKKKGT